ncbi:MAG: hypothetical protein JO227_04315 [Acetobacteraceae bacterium]|nr:hypothetical protein [Acetobacteraceae bacterium]
MKPCADKNVCDLSGIETSLKKLLEANLTLGGEVLKLFGAGASGAMSGLGALKMPKFGSCCDIPDPCWMPHLAGEAHCCLAPGGSGEIRMTVTNTDRVPRSFSITAAGFGAPLVSFSATSIALGPKERTLVTATIAIPSSQAPQSAPYDVVIWVRGCREHYLRWIVRITAESRTCCYEVDIDDEPNYIVHWYDHFYCPRPCPTSQANR